MSHLSLFMCILVFVVVTFSQECTDLGYPKHYVNYKLRGSEKIIFDGKLDEPAWNDVAWTDDFQDILGPAKPAPYFHTRAKLRWDDQYLYIAAFMEEPQLWANLTINNSIIFRDNDFEVFIDPNGCNHWYKELELNARNLNWNLLLVRPYRNGGPAVCNVTEPGMCSPTAPEWGVPWWNIAPDLPSGVYIDGKLNDPVVGTKYWTMEIGIPIKEYLRYEPDPSPPKEGSLWRLDFSRVQWHITVHEQPDGKKVYWKIPGVPEENWVWQPQYIIDMHLPERWGYIQFTEQPINTTNVARDPQWPSRDALMKVFYAELEYFTTHQRFTENLTELVAEAELPSYVATGKCTGIPVIKLVGNGSGYVVTVTKDGMVGNVRDDRFLWFDK